MTDHSDLTALSSRPTTDGLVPSFGTFLSSFGTFLWYLPLVPSFGTFRWYLPLVPSFGTFLWYLPLVPSFLPLVASFLWHLGEAVGRGELAEGRDRVARAVHVRQLALGLEEGDGTCSYRCSL